MDAGVIITNQDQVGQKVRRTRLSLQNKNHNVAATIENESRLNSNRAQLKPTSNQKIKTAN